MADWYENPWQTGTKVEVYGVNHDFIGIGTLTKDYNPASEDPNPQDMPEIQMEDGRIIRGCDCFWMPVEVAEDIKKNLREYTINVKVKGYGGLAMNAKVLAKNPDDATHIACSHEPRYQDSDPYLLLVYVNDKDDTSVFCTYETLAEGLEHLKSITAGRWEFVQRDGASGVILKSWEDEDE